MSYLASVQTESERAWSSYRLYHGRLAELEKFRKMFGGVIDTRFVSPGRFKSRKVYHFLYL